MKKLWFVVAFFFLITLSWSCKTVVSEKPAEPVVAARPVQPNPSYVWINGEWYRSGNTYKYREGYWVTPRTGHSWVEGHWVQNRRGYYWVKGHWN